jgi:hypothetical protein
MLTFNAVLRHEGIDPKVVRLVRHQDKRRAGRPTPYNLWRANDGRFETYQKIQGRKVFDVGNILASFVVTPSNQTLFVGLYSVVGIGRAPPGIVDPIGQHDVSGAQFYDIRFDQRLDDLAGRLIIDWGDGFRAWVQRAGRRDKSVLEIKREITDPQFPGFTGFCWDVDEIASIPLTWQEILKSVKGVYLLVCKETGRVYVGSAKGEESLWGRFVEYARTGHGGNVELKRRGHGSYQVTVLEVVNSDTGIERIEAAWKKKLLSREFGLNEN